MAIQTMARRSHEALRASFEEHYLPLLRLCVSLTGRRDLAEDIVQEAFVRAAPKIDGLDLERVRPYLRRIVVNLWKNRLRRLALEVRHLQISERDRMANPPDDRLEVWRALGRLPDRQRACVVLRFYEDLTEREVSETLGCSVGTVKSHTSRALAKLRKELSDDG